MKKLLVTGGMGFIGSNFILYMLKKYPDYHITNLDLMTYAGNKENDAEAATAPNYQLVLGDIGDEALLDQIMGQGMDAVVHFAAESHVDCSIIDPHRFVETNVLGTHHLLNAGRRHGVKKFIHVSTDEVYGSLGPEGYFTEKTPLSPNSPYSASKAGSDLLVRSYYETFGFPAIITRCSNNYGPRQFPEKFIPMTITNALQNKPIPVYGDGLNVRDWLYVDDHCSAIDLVLHQGNPGEVYNIGGNNEHRNLDIALHILDLLGKPTSLLQFVADRLGHDRRYAIDATKIKTALGWKPALTFEKGIENTIAWYVDNEQWWKINILNGDYLR